MKKKIFFIILSLIISLLIQFGYLYLKSEEKTYIAGLTTNNSSIINSAFIGEFRFTLFGYTSPKALVTFSGQGIFDQTQADKKGYFEFTNRFSPFSPHEACLSAKDQFGRLSSPTCLPPFPVNTNVKIGPVILSPTISLNKNNFYVNEEIILSGQSIPNSNVDLLIFTQETSFNKFFSFFVKSVNAFSIPKLQTKTDNLGNFSISLPSGSSQKYRFFTQVNYLKNSSANSLILTIDVLPIWMIISKFFGFIFNFLKPRLLEIVIFAEILSLIYYFFKIFHDHHQIKSIVLYEQKPIIKSI